MTEGSVWFEWVCVTVKAKYMEVVWHSNLWHWSPNFGVAGSIPPEAFREFEISAPFLCQCDYCVNECVFALRWLPCDV